MHILVIGGNGYLGSKVVRKLIERNDSIVCTKRLGSDLSRLADIKEKIKWIPASIDAVETAAQYISFDCVINMSCNYGREDEFYGNIIEANMEFPLKVLNKTVEGGIKKFVTIGTGLPDDLNMYSFSKKIFGEFGRFYAQKKGVDFYNLLFEMFYGADEPSNRFLPAIISNMLSGKEINTTLGTQCRDIISVRDSVNAIMMVIDSDLHGYNEIPIGTGEAPAISDIIDYIWNETGKKSKINKGAVLMRKDEPNCVADVSIMQSIGNWNPVSWRQGIRQMINEIKSNVVY